MRKAIRLVAFLTITSAIGFACLTDPVALAQSGAVAKHESGNIYESSEPAIPRGEIDRIIFAKLSEKGIAPSLCSDAVFVRRAYLDVIGTLPTAAEVRAFLEDPDAENKRITLIDQLLQRDEFVDYWAMQWGDLLRIKAEFPINLWPNGAQAYHRYVRSSIAVGKPYDQFVRELLVSSGSNYRVGQVNFYRALQNKTPEGITSAVALTFMGTRTDNWTAEQVARMSVFFAQIGYKPTSEWKEEHVFWDPLGASRLQSNIAIGQEAITTAAPELTSVSELAPLPTEPQKATLPDGTVVSIAPSQDPRVVFADWLITAENPWFTKAIVNRVWAWTLGRGIINPPDDLRDDNPASHPQLLKYLQQELVASDYDLKHLQRLILTSTTYQFSSLPKVDDEQQTPLFASYPLRRLEAEVLIDAINTITGTTDLYTSAVAEPFTYIPKDQPAIALADGSITSPFLTLFGRSARATGMASERNNQPVSAQWLHMLNSSHIQSKIDQSPKLRQMFAARQQPAQIARQIYLTVLSRYPTPQELQAIKTYVDNQATKRFASADVVWALMNSPEFLYRH